MSASDVDLHGLFNLGTGNALYNKSNEIKDGPYVYNTKDPEHLQPKYVLRSFVLTLDLRNHDDLQALQVIRQAAAAGSARITAQSEQWVPEDRNWRVLLIGYINEVMAPKHAKEYWLTSAVQALEAINKKQGSTNERSTGKLPGQHTLGEAGVNSGPNQAADRVSPGISS